MIERLPVTYHEYGELLGKLLDRLDGRYFCVYGPPRGGLPIAVHISHHLSIPLLSSEHELHDITMHGNGDSVLIVDDIADTGKSLVRLINRYSEQGVRINTACLFYKSRSVIEPDIWLKQVDDTCWVVFPWERMDESPNRDLR